MNLAQPAIQVHDVCKLFRSHAALASVTVSVGQAETYVLLGPNGAGKTTLLHIILGLLRPTSGTATVLGIPVEGPSISARVKLGFVPETVQLYDWLTAVENVRLIAGASRASVSRKDAEHSLRTAGLDGRWFDRTTRVFSKGMRQRVGIAVALARRAEVLILDEPTSGLDPLAAEALVALLSALRNAGMTTLICTHDIHRMTADHVRYGVLHDGRLISEFRCDDGSDVEERYRLAVRDAQSTSAADATLAS